MLVLQDVRVTAFCLVFAAIAAVAGAQDPATSFEQLRARVGSGDRVTVTDTAGRDRTGTILALSASSIELIVNGSRATLRERDVRTITRSRRDSRWNGTLWGAAIGAGVGALLAIPTIRGHSKEYGAENSGGIWEMFALLGGGIGGGTGFVADTLVETQDAIYISPYRNGLSWTWRF
jgi:hypothetical protein